MAIIGTSEDDPNNPNSAKGAGGAASQTGGTSAPATGGGAGGFVSGGAGQGATTSVNPAATTSSGSFTNLTSYLNANQGGGATNGKAVENVVDQAGQAADSAVGGYQTAGVNQANAGAVGVDQNALGKISGGAGTFSPADAAKIAGGVNNGIFTNPNLAAPTYTGGAAPTVSYGGPSDVSSLTGDAANAKKGAYSQVQGLVGQRDDSTGQYHGGMVGQAGGGQAGVASLLKNTYTQPSYTAGENGLDAFLTGGTAGGQAALSKIQSDWGGEGGKFDAAGNAIGSAITSAKSTTDATNAAYQKAYNDAQSATAAAKQQQDQAVFAAKAKAGQEQAAKNSMVAKKTISQPSQAGSQPTLGQIAGVPSVPGTITSQTPGQMAGAGQPIQSPTSDPSNGGFAGVLTSIGQNVGAGYQNSQAGGAVDNATDVVTGKKKFW